MRRSRRLLMDGTIAAAACALVVVTATGGHATQARRGRAPAAASTATPATPKVLAAAGSNNLPSDCVPNSAGPPTAPYQLGLVGTVQGGTLSTGTAKVADISANFCGVVTVVNSGSTFCPVTGQLATPPDGQVYGSLSVELTLVPGMTPTIGFSPTPAAISGTFSCTTGSRNGLLVTLDATVSGTTSSVFGVQCAIGPFTIPLTGAITGPFSDLTGMLTSSNFTVPTIAASPTCPAEIASSVDTIAGLPLAPGQASVTLPVTASLYQPAGQP
ncbi:MAG TPA: hypothetical protein VK386_01055 [Acidimicrobiales bacterium]|nr:hypothetical protein [Acidimicrobiales bacterium]